MSQSLLDALSVDELRLGSAGPIDLFGNAKLSAQQLVFDAGGLYGYANGGNALLLGA